MSFFVFVEYIKIARPNLSFDVNVMFYLSFSNSLIIHKENSKEISV